MAIYYKTQLDHTFHALGDETRRGILAILATNGPSSANELLAPFDVAQPTISKHLKVLEKAGLVKRHVEGRVHRFQMETAAIREAQDWMERHQAFWEGTLNRLEVFLNATDDTEGLE